MPTDPGYIGPCTDRDEGVPHGPHEVLVGHCAHEASTWCYGVPQPGTVQAAVEGLVPGQSVRIVWEGVVEEFGRYASAMTQGCRDAVVACVPGQTDARIVLRYTGEHPAIAENPEKVAGRLHGGIVSVEVLGGGACDCDGSTCQRAATPPADA